MWKRSAANHLRQIKGKYGHEHSANSLGIASSNHRICSLKIVRIASSAGAYLGGDIVPWPPPLGRQDCKIA